MSLDVGRSALIVSLGANPPQPAFDVSPYLLDPLLSFHSLKCTLEGPEAELEDCQPHQVTLTLSTLNPHRAGSARRMLPTARTLSCPNLHRYTYWLSQTCVADCTHPVLSKLAPTHVQAQPDMCCRLHAPCPCPNLHRHTYRLSQTCVADCTHPVLVHTCTDTRTGSARHVSQTARMTVWCAITPTGNCIDACGT